MKPGMPAISRERRHAGLFVCIVVAGIAMSQNALARPIDTIRLSRIASLTTTEIELGCAMHYRGHTPTGGGSVLRIRLQPGYDCVNVLRASPRSIHRPQGGRMAYLSTLEFDSSGKNQATITLHFDRTVSFMVEQTSNPYLLTIKIDVSSSTAAEAEPKAKPSVVNPVTQAPVPPPRNKGASHLIHRPQPAAPDRYALYLAEVTLLNDVQRRSLKRIDTKLLYANRFVLDGRKWHELRLGFFDTEAAAQAKLDSMQSVFPFAWISIATAAQQAVAETQPYAPNDNLSAVKKPKNRVLVASHKTPLEPLPDERIAALMVDAKDAMLHGDFDQSIRIYTRVLQQAAASQRPAAREFLGVAHRKNGQIALAKAEFENYLTEYPDAPGTHRVKQRLVALLGNTRRPTNEVATRHTSLNSGGWKFNGALSQFYFRGVNLSRDDEPDVLSQSELLSQLSFAAQRRGDRFDLLVNGNLGYLHDLEDNDVTNQARAAYLYIDIKDNELDLTSRLGRQTQHRAGVLGRFDGMHIGYKLWRALSVNVTAGFPVDSPRFLADTDHYFYGASVGLSNVLDVLDFGMFTNLQTIDGIPDRRAVGADAQFHSRRFNVFGLVDYDASYRVLNNGLVVANWRLNDRLSLHGRYQGGAGPYLSTRNAIIGQPLVTIDALLGSYSEGQIRRLARNRTAQVRSGTGGLSVQVTQRWHLNADLIYDEYGSTVASGGVAGLPATGPQIVYSGQLIGSSVFKAGDSVILSYRQRQTRNGDADTVIVDMRVPVGEGLRINPRIAVTLQNRNQQTLDATQQWIVNPMLRVFYSWRRKYRIEFEIGGHWSDQELPSSLQSSPTAAESIETSAYYLQLGYWMDFR